MIWDTIEMLFGLLIILLIICCFAITATLFALAMEALL